MAGNGTGFDGACCDGQVASGCGDFAVLFHVVELNAHCVMRCDTVYVLGFGGTNCYRVYPPHRQMLLRRRNNGYAPW